jgi:hypothetical protein
VVSCGASLTILTEKSKLNNFTLFYRRQQLGAMLVFVGRLYVLKIKKSTFISENALSISVGPPGLEPYLYVAQNQ